MSVHLMQLSSLLEIEYDSVRGNKFAKKHIINTLGFYKAGPGFNESRDFIISGQDDYEINKITKFVREECSKNRVATLRFINDGGKLGGGYPVIYVRSNSDFDSFFKFNQDGKLEKWQTIDGREVLPSKGLAVNIFTNASSVKIKSCGFDNYPMERLTAIGGGFRLQLDRFTNYEWQFTVVMVFDDVGPRATGLSSDYEMEIPRITFSYLYHPNSHRGNVLPDPIKSSLDQGNINIVARKIIDELFDKDHQVIERLLRSLISLRPSEKLHSLEGIFSVQSDGDRCFLLGPEVTDFDGLDTLEAWLG